MSLPTLRFREFSNHWSVHKVGDVCDFIVPGRNKPTDFNGDIPWITTPDILQNTEITHSKKNLNISKAEAKKIGSKIVPKNSIIISCVGDLGLVAFAGRELIINQQLHAFIPNENVYFKFLLYALTIKKPYMEKVATKTAVPYMNKDNCNSIPIALPLLSEQTKIASFLSSVDEKITQLTQKHDLLTQYKKGVMQQIFSQKSRFKDDDGGDFPEWEEKLASDIFVNVANKSHDGELPILAATQDKGMIYREDSGIDIKSSEASIKSYKIVEKGDFVISLRSFQGGIEYSNLMGICSPAYTVMKPKIDINDGFFKAYFKKDDFIESLNSLVIGIRDGKQISYSAFSTLVLPNPSLKEQAKIANFLTAIDDKISATQSQLQAVNQYKQGLLQQMFV